VYPVPSKAQPVSQIVVRPPVLTRTSCSYRPGICEFKQLEYARVKSHRHMPGMNRMAKVAGVSANDSLPSQNSKGAMESAPSQAGSASSLSFQDVIDGERALRRSVCSSLHGQGFVDMCDQ
jgi:hypothetical protein